MKLSVVIPAYNRAILLPLTLNSLLAQERVADEILVVDDGSTDGTAEVAEAFGHPVRVIRQCNQGPSAARNRGLGEARGEFIHFFDSDDLALPNLHKIQLKTLEHSNADVAYSPWVKARLNPLHGVQPTNHVFQKRGLPSGSLVRALLTNWSVVPICCLIRRSLAVQSCGFPTTLDIAEDQLFFLRLLLKHGTVVHTSSTLVLYRDEEHAKLSSGGSRSKDRNLVDWARFLVMADSECRHRNVDPSRWFGFCRRVYLAAQSLKRLENPPVSLINELLTIVSASPMPNAFYHLSRLAQQKGESIASRLYGRRAHRSFRSSPLNPTQHLIATQHLDAISQSREEVLAN